MTLEKSNDYIEKNSGRNYSRLSLIFGIGSVSFSGFAIGLYYIFRFLGNFEFYERTPKLFIQAIPFIIILLIGTIFGLLSRRCNKKALETEYENNFKKASSKVGNMGLALNIAGLTLVIWILFSIFQYLYLNNIVNEFLFGG